MTVLAVSFVLGGGTRQGMPIESLLQLLGLVLVGLGVLRLSRRTVSGKAKLLLVLWGVMTCWFLVTILPLSGGWGSGLQGREALLESLTSAEVDARTLSISLDREATLRAVLAWLPPLGMFLFALSLRHHQRVSLLRGVVLLACGSVLLGMAQLAAGPESSLRWHDFTNETSAVGPFANRNHLATVIVLAVPLAAAALLDSAGRNRRWMGSGTTPWIVALVLLLLGLALTKSRAGLVLGALSMFGCLALMLRFSGRSPHRADDERERPATRYKFLLALLLGTVAVVQWGLAGVIDRLDKDPLEDFRWTIAESTWEIAQRHGPWGTGAGTFEQVYESEAPLLRATDKVVNRAHNDWLEWRLEGGWPLISIIVLGLGILMAAAFEPWRDPGPGSIWLAAVSLGGLCVVLHSFVDYPLRTTAVATVCALLAAHLVSSRRGAAADSSHGHRVSHGRPPG